MDGSAVGGRCAHRDQVGPLVKGFAKYFSLGGGLANLSGGLFTSAEGRTGSAQGARVSAGFLTSQHVACMEAAMKLLRVIPWLLLPMALACQPCAAHDPGSGAPTADASSVEPLSARVAPSASAVAAGSSVVSAISSGVSGTAPVPPFKFNVLLITIDALRADMPWAGYARAIAPRLTELEARSVSYTSAYAISSYTSMSVGGMLSGEYPSSMKRDGYFFGVFPKDNLMFPERLKAAGVRTLAAHAHRYFVPSSGFSQGFDIWEIVAGIKFDPQTDPNVTGPKHLALAEKLLSDPANTSGQFFAWFHFMDPHDAYVLHGDVPSWGSSARDRYDGEVQFTDIQVGKLLDFVANQPWASRTAIVISSDHGEGFGEHGVYRHGFELNQELVRIPWFFAIPGVAPRRIDAPRGHIDMAPTILDLMGVPQGDAPLRGKSLVGEILGQEPAQSRAVVLDLPRTSDSDRRRSIIDGPIKIIAYGDDAYFRVFDLSSDPEEKYDLKKKDPEAFARMVERYKTISKTIKEMKPYGCRTLKGAPDSGEN